MFAPEPVHTFDDHVVFCSLLFLIDENSAHGYVCVCVHTRVYVRRNIVECMKPIDDCPLFSLFLRLCCYCCFSLYVNQFIRKIIHIHKCKRDAFFWRRMCLLSTYLNLSEKNELCFMHNFLLSVIVVFLSNFGVFYEKCLRLIIKTLCSMPLLLFSGVVARKIVVSLLRHLFSFVTFSFPLSPPCAASGLFV